jgi:xanthine dehydrogenase molybdopterin-binding subunit B
MNNVKIALLVICCVTLVICTFVIARSFKAAADAAEASIEQYDQIDSSFDASIEEAQRREEERSNEYSRRRGDSDQPVGDTVVVSEP